MEDNKVPYIVFEESQARHERTVKRMIMALVMCIALLFASNVAWLWFFNQFDYAIETVTQGTEVGDNSYVGEDGVINNGEADRN